MVRVERDMTAGISVASAVAQPNVIAEISQYKR